MSLPTPFKDCKPKDTNSKPSVFSNLSMVSLDTNTLLGLAMDSNRLATFTTSPNTSSSAPLFLIGIIAIEGTSSSEWAFTSFSL